MATRLLIVHESPLPAEGWAEISGPDLDCRFVELASLRPESLERCAADVVVIAAINKPSNAIALFHWLRTHTPAAPTLAILPTDPKVELLDAVSGCVDDFVLWPVRATEWRQRITRLLGPSGTDHAEIRGRIMEELGLSQLIGRAPAFVQTVARIPLAARSNSPVLITGETGTGKELCARAVHHLGPRARHPFIPVDCGALPDHLFENEVFGHAKGAFTDARADQRGLVAMADGGTLFLDEVDALPLLAQSKLLRFLQERTFKPLGADRFHHADVNVLAATNGDLDALVREKRFRSDLYFRLNVLSLHLVPLRARREDIPLLARHFAQSISRERGGVKRTISPPALRKLMAYDWPGNARELYNVIQRAVVFAEGEAILPAHLAQGRLRQSAGRDHAGVVPPGACARGRELRARLRRGAPVPARRKRDARRPRRAEGPPRVRTAREEVRPSAAGLVNPSAFRRLSLLKRRSVSPSAASAEKTIGPPGLVIE